MRLINLFLITLLLGSLSIFAQTSAFTYQGSLNDNSTQANGTYQMRFSLFNVQTGGNPVGSSIEITAVQVENGIFSVSLDFGAAAFDGSNRFLNVEVRRNSGENYVALSPREQIKSVPYAVRAAASGNADQLGGVNSSQYVTSSSNVFIQNTTVQQTGSFNISGIGTAGSFNTSGSGSGYSINGQRVLSLSQGFTGGSIFIGRNTIGSIASDGNTFVGNDISQTSGGGISGNFNTFVGDSAVMCGNRNTLIGAGTGDVSNCGSDNTLIGMVAEIGNNLNFATAIGAGSLVSTSNTIQLGRVSDRTNVSGKFNVLNGRALPVERGDVNLLTSSGNFNLYMQGAFNGNGINLAVQTPVSGNSTFFISHFDGTTYQDRLVIKPNGAVEIRVLGTGGNVQLCRNSSSNEISTCSSSLRYKSNVADFSNGLNIVKKPRPVSFRWKDGGMLDFGLVAEEVAEVEPLLTTQNEKGETEGVKYDRVGVILVNAVNQQQKQIEDQQAEIEKQKAVIAKQQSEIELLKKQQKEFVAIKALVCSTNREAELCKTENQITAENPESAVKENK